MSAGDPPARGNRDERRSTGAFEALLWGFNKREALRRVAVRVAAAAGTVLVTGSAGAFLMRVYRP